MELFLVGPKWHQEHPSERENEVNVKTKAEIGVVQPAS